MGQAAPLSAKEKFGVLGVIVLLVVIGLAVSYVIGENASIPQYLPLAISLVLAAFTTLIFVGLFQAVSMLGFSTFVTFFGTGDVSIEELREVFAPVFEAFAGLLEGDSSDNAQ
ncbi:hypothetical protein [uncultured Erythrobacter sp.]|uniref:hypothetical protein n=1 Tax=uncultured Erythrobacter sp. TaxID=263913 RepID=UPI0026350187|nr:hypothetical protein [uncultured Erythrobacter sp.]